MQFQTKDNRQIFIRRLQKTDLNNLYSYLHNLSDETKRRFGPHSFDRHSLTEFYESDCNLGFVAIAAEKNEILAYSIIKIGFLEHDKYRLESYGLNLNNETDATFAPSVADLWQGFGIGKHLFDFILSNLENHKIQRIILWGGVQLDNHHAINYYKKIGFETLGQFTYNGENYDMIFRIHQIKRNRTDIPNSY